MTLIELFFFLLNIALGVFLARVLHPIGGLWLAIPGFVAGVLFIPGLVFAYERYRKWTYCGDYFMPHCICGMREFKVEKAGDEFHIVCQSCGRRYDKRKDKVFAIEDGTHEPYMQLVRRRGWVAMNSQQADGGHSG